jgi:hypothetical protein
MSKRVAVAILAALSAASTCTGRSTAQTATDAANADTPESLKRRADEAMMELRYRPALELYQRAYALRADPALLYNQARASQALDDFPSALDFLERFAREAPESLRNQVPKLAELLSELRSKVSHVRFEINTREASVTVRGRVLGKVPSDAISLNAGEADIQVNAPGFRPFEKHVLLRGGESLTLSVQLVPLSNSGVLRVTSNASGAVVEVDGRRIGTAPAETAVSAGRHGIAVSAPGHQLANTTAVLGAGERKTVKVTLTETAPITESWWFWGGAAAVLAGGAALTWVLVSEPEPDSGSIPPGQVSAPLLAF